MSGLVSDAIQLGFLPSDVNKETLLPVLQKVYDSAKIKAQEMTVTRDRSRPLAFRSIERRKHLSGVSRDLNEIFFLHPFTVPSYFALITRALITLEGIALTGDPQFDIFRASHPYAQARALQIFGAKGVAQIIRASPLPVGQLLGRGLS